MRRFIEKQAVCENGRLNILMQPTESVIVNELKDAYKRNNNLEIKHLLGMHSGKKEANIKNLKILEEIVPVILCEKRGKYEVVAFFDHLESHYNSFSSMPYFLVSEEELLLVDVGLKRAVLTQNQEIVKLYQEKFEEMYRSGQAIYSYIGGMEKHFDIYRGVDIISDKMCHISNQLCCGLYDIDFIVENYVLEDAVSSIKEVLKINLPKKQAIQDGSSQLILYCTKRGLEEFFKEGVIEELPKESYTPINFLDRKKFLEQVVDKHKKDRIKVRIIDEKKYKYPEGLEIMATSAEKITFLYERDHIESCLVLEAEFLSGVFYDFLTNLENSMYLYNEEETMEYLEEIKRWLEEKIQ